MTSAPNTVTTTAQQADAAIQSPTWLAAESALQDAASRWRQQRWLGLDTEFVRERTFYPRPGLVQVSDGSEVWLVDALAEIAFTPLAETLADTATTKILHSVGEDLEILAMLTQGQPLPLFDTQIAAALLGHPLQVRYEHLVEQELGANLPGGKARSDWCRRPLDHDLLCYAASDVIWLPRLAETLAEQLNAKQRLHWLEEDCARLLDTSQREATHPVTRVKGAAGLDDESLALAARLARWRDRQAQARDLPRSFVLRDEQLMALAKHGAAALTELPPPAQRRHGEALRAELDAGPEADFCRPIELTALTEADRAAIKQLQVKVAEVAESLAVEPAVLASKKQLTRLVRGERPAWLDGWRGQWLAPALRDH
jgi:ribonuclease D